MWQWASALIGAAASKAVGGNAQVVAITASSRTKNNILAYYLTNMKDALKTALKSKGGKEPTEQEINDLNEQISLALNYGLLDGQPNIEVEGSIIRGILQANNIPAYSIDQVVLVLWIRKIPV